jgi:hypothetical protein
MKLVKEGYVTASVDNIPITVGQGSYNVSVTMELIRPDILVVSTKDTVWTNTGVYLEKGETVSGEITSNLLVPIGGTLYHIEYWGYSDLNHESNPSYGALYFKIGNGIESNEFAAWDIFTHEPKTKNYGTITAMESGFLYARINLKKLPGHELYSSDRGFIDLDGLTGSISVRLD